MDMWKLMPPYTGHTFHASFINMLSGEVLWRIFRHIASAQGTTAEERAPVVLTLIHVCKRWRTLILSSPELWAPYVSAAQGSPLALFLHKVPIFVLGSQSSQHCRSPNALTDLLTSLRLEDHSYPPPHQTFPATSLPDRRSGTFKLHHNTICDDQERGSHPLCLDASLASDLRILDLVGCYITLPRTLTQYVHLKVLRMKDVDKGVAMGASEWVYVLQNLPELEELEICNALGYHYAGTNEPGEGDIVRPIVCEKLRSFKFAAESRLSLTLLPRITMPNSSNIDLEFFWEQEMSMETIDRFLEQISRISVTRPRKEQLQYHQLWFELTATSFFFATDFPRTDRRNPPIPEVLGPPSFSIRVSVPLSSKFQLDLPSLVPTLIDCVVPSRHDVKSIGFKGSFSDAFLRYDSRSLTSIFSNFEFVEQLSVYMNNVDSLRQLTDTLSTPDNDVGILLPALRGLTLEASLDGHQNASASMLMLVADFMMKRKERDHPVLELTTRLSEKRHPLAVKLRDTNPDHVTSIPSKNPPPEYSSRPPSYRTTDVDDGGTRLSLFARWYSWLRRSKHNMAANQRL